LLRKLAINRSNQVWALDTTYIAMAKGFVYLTAVVDVASRKVLAHRVAITLEAVHVKDVIEEAFSRYGTPEIVNTDQGRQFTATEFTDAVLARGCKLCMDCRGARRDNVFVERLWRSVKYERVYLKAYAHRERGQKRHRGLLALVRPKQAAFELGQGHAQRPLRSQPTQDAEGRIR
jgi:putative transposase